MILSQSWFSLPTYWQIGGEVMIYNIETDDINRDGKKDIIVGNWNDTYVYFGGKNILDKAVDVIYKGRCLTICDYNGDGINDLIALRFTYYDSTRFDYDGVILFYYGSGFTSLAIDTIPEYSIPIPTRYPKNEGFGKGSIKDGICYGDFNNDGKSDLVFSSWNYPAFSSHYSHGKIFIYMGKSIPNDSADFIVEGKYNANDFSYYFEVGNINGDEYDDLLVSSRKLTSPPGVRKDSLNMLHIWYGKPNFTFYADSEDVKYVSRVDQSIRWSEWFVMQFSVDDINGDGISDLIISYFSQDSTNHVHFGSVNGIDTIPSFYITDPDTTNKDVVVGSGSHDIGDFNNDGYNDFILKGAYYKSFSLHLGGPRLSNKNPYGLRGLLKAFSFFPTKAINCGDQNGDRVKDFVVTAYPFSLDYMGYVLVFLGDPTIVTDIIESEGVTPSEFKLHQNHPNPFNPSTKIKYAIGSRQYATLKIYDILGKEIVTLLNEEKEAGEYEVEFDASKYNLSSGVYFCELKLKQGFSSKIKMIYLK